MILKEGEQKYPCKLWSNKGHFVSKWKKPQFSSTIPKYERDQQSIYMDNMLCRSYMRSSFWNWKDKIIYLKIKAF